MSLSQTDFPRDWLAQFSGAERLVAEQLADAVMLVGHDALYRGLRLLLDETTTNRDEGDQDRPIALFAERAVETRDAKDDEYGFVRHEVLPFFPGTDEGRACQRRRKSRPLGGAKPGHLIRVLASAGRA